MDLILWRHADAAPVKNESEPDIQRRLTGKGREQATVMAIWLERQLPDSVSALGLAGQPERGVDCRASTDTRSCSLTAAVG